MTTILSQQESAATPVNIFGNEDYFDPLNCAEKWKPNMRRPFGFGQVEIDRFQKTINRITGTYRDQPIIKLVWMPDIFEWTPYPLGSSPVGYKFPTWTALKDKDGELVAPPRWGLMERMEPEQYLPGWESGRWVIIDNQMHDAKGPPPEDGLYTMWHRHIKHHSACCSRAGNEDDCWGFYVEPNAELLDYIGMRAFKARSDKDVEPTTPVEHLSSSRNDLKVKEQLEAQRVHVPEGVGMTRLLPGYIRRPESGLYTIGD